MTYPKMPLLTVGTADARRLPDFVDTPEDHVSAQFDITEGNPTGACDTTAVRPPCVHMFMTLLVGGGLGFLAGLAWRLRRTRGRRERDDLGTVSESWAN
jgi:hypothetical protein